jgi:hypothetical protein
MDGLLVDSCWEFEAVTGNKLGGEIGIQSLLDAVTAVRVA